MTISAFLAPSQSNSSGPVLHRQIISSNWPAEPSNRLPSWPSVVGRLTGQQSEDDFPRWVHRWSWKATMTVAAKRERSVAVRQRFQQTGGGLECWAGRTRRSSETHISFGHHQTLSVIVKRRIQSEIRNESGRRTWYTSRVESNGASRQEKNRVWRLLAAVEPHKFHPKNRTNIPPLEWSKTHSRDYHLVYLLRLLLVVRLLKTDCCSVFTRLL